MSLLCVLVLRLCQIFISVVASICPKACIQLCKLSWDPLNRALQSVRSALLIELFSNSEVMFGSPVRYVPSSGAEKCAVSSFVKSCWGEETAADTAKLKSRMIKYILGEEHKTRAIPS